MALHGLFLLMLSFAFLTFAAKVNCPCGWQLSSPSPGTSPIHFTHRIYDDFSQYDDTSDLLSSPKARRFSEQWVVDGYLLPTNDPEHAHDQQFNPDSVSINSGHLLLKQLAYSDEDKALNRPVQISGIQTRTLDVLHGSFRVVLKLNGAKGGSVGSFFWYHNETSEIDVEIVTAGNSVVNDTINYTSHPSLDAHGLPIPNATLSVPFTDYGNFHSHRFDCTPDKATYYLDGKCMHEDKHNIPHSSGSIQLNLWADGNKLWSGVPSTADVTMSVKLIEVYYNTTETDNGTDKKWLRKCDKAGGPSDKTVCREGQTSPMASQSTTSSGSASDGSNNAGGMSSSGEGDVGNNDGHGDDDGGSKKSESVSFMKISYCKWLFAQLVVLLFCL